MYLSHIFATNPAVHANVLHAPQGFMQDNIIVSHTCFGGHMDVNC